MSEITTRQTPDASLEPESGKTSVTRTVTLSKCLRCGFEWMPRVAKPVRCPDCGSVLWNVERSQQLPGKPAPTRKGKPRGKPLQSGFDSRRTRKPQDGADSGSGSSTVGA